MATYSYDDSKHDLRKLLESDGFSKSQANAIINQLTPSHDGTYPVEVSNDTGPISDLLTPGHNQPEILILEGSPTQVNTDNFSNLQTIVQVADADLEVTGHSSVNIITGDYGVNGPPGNFTVDLEDYGDDIVHTGNGNDTVNGGHGADSIYAGNGQDLL